MLGIRENPFVLPLAGAPSQERTKIYANGRKHVAMRLQPVVIIRLNGTPASHATFRRE